MKLSVAMIVRNEEAAIEQCLRSVQDADEIVILDTGSVDRTADVVRSLGLEHVRLIEGEYAWKDDFADAWNNVLERCTGSWVLHISAARTLEEGGIEKIRRAINSAPKGVTGFNVWMQHRDSEQRHVRGLICKRAPGVKWIGAVHENIQMRPGPEPVATITFWRSPSHGQDPNRNLRILRKLHQRHPYAPRWMYYLAVQEYVPRGRWKDAIVLLRRHVKLSKHKPERADAYLQLARIYWHLQQGDLAREACAQALIINSHFKEAALFMAEMSFPENKGPWLAMAETGTNERVYFERVG